MQIQLYIYIFLLLVVQNNTFCIKNITLKKLPILMY